MLGRFLRLVKTELPHDARDVHLRRARQFDSMVPNRVPGLLLAVTVPVRAEERSPQRRNMPGRATLETRLRDWSAGQGNRLAIALRRCMC